MRVFYIDSLDDIETKCIDIERNSLVMFGFGIHLEINLVKELEGESNIFRLLRDFSIKKNLVLIVGLSAKIYRREYLSIACIDKGKILGISDATHRTYLDAKYNLGASYRVYKTSLGRVGIVVHSDILYPEVIRSISMANSDLIVGLAGGILKNRAQMLLRAHSYCNGIMMFFGIEDSLIVTDRNGDVLEGEISGKDIIISRDFGIVKGRRAGIYDNIYNEGE